MLLKGRPLQLCASMPLVNVESGDLWMAEDISVRRRCQRPVDLLIEQLGESESTGVHYLALEEQEPPMGAACLACATAIQKDASAHLKLCTSWLTMPGGGDLNLVEQRLIALVSLDQQPDLSKGRSSFAGHFAGDKKKKKVTFE